MPTKAHAKNPVLTILGCGTSSGVPLMFCKCAVCRSKNPKNHRTRTSAWIRIGGKSILIDTSPDFRAQAMREKIPRVDAVLFTHPHADHVHGIDELRSFNYHQKEEIPVYGNDWTCDELAVKFAYIFKPIPNAGGGVPQLALNRIDSRSQNLEIKGISVIPLALKHGSMESLGYRLESIAYVTDCSYIPQYTLDRMKGLSVLVLDCLRIAPHGTHFNLDQALEVVEKIRPQKTFLTHMGHDFDYTKWSKKLPRGVFLAYDGLKIRSGSTK
jgi:phosphoribosyl 1,2-cyclic phosphate phosphodiesterase